MEIPTVSPSIIGVAVAILGNICISLALNIQKQVHNHLELNTSYLSSKAWWMGMILMILGELGNFTAYGFAPAILVAPLGTVALISNAIIAPCYLGENFTVRDVFGISFSIIGTMIILAVSANTSEPTLSPKDIVDAISEPMFVFYFILTMVALIALINISNTDIGKRYILVDLLIASIIGGYTVLSVKAVSSLLKLSFYKMFAFWITYPMLLILSTTAVAQIHFINRALASFDSIQVIPTNFVLFTSFSILGSSILYKDLTRTDPIALLGVAFMFLGVYLITSKTKDYAPVPATDLSEQAQDWESYHEWNMQHQELWNPPSSWNSPINNASTKGESSSIPTGDLFNLSSATQGLGSYQSSTFVHHNSSPSRFNLDNDGGSSVDIDSTLRRLSTGLGGTFQIRKMEFDRMSDSKSQGLPSPSR